MRPAALVWDSAEAQLVKLCSALLSPPPNCTLSLRGKIILDLPCCHQEAPRTVCGISRPQSGQGAGTWGDSLFWERAWQKNICSLSPTSAGLGPMCG